MSIPRKDSELLKWSTNADTHLTASPGAYGTTPAVAAQYHTVHSDFILAYANLVAARESGVRSSPLASTKEDAKRGLLAFARPLYRTIQVNTAVTDAARIELGVLVPDNTRTPIPTPSFAPGLSIVSVDGRRVKIRLFDPAFPDRMRMPDEVSNATVMSFIGPTAPANPRDYQFARGTSKIATEVLFPDIATPGTRVWLTAFFSNNRQQNGPACAPVGTFINYGGTIPMAA